MKILVLLFLYFAFCFAEFSSKNYLGLEYKSYLKKQDKRIDNNSAITFQSQIEYEKEDYKIQVLVEALKDTKEEQRDFFRGIIFY